MSEENTSEQQSNTEETALVEASPVATGEQPLDSEETVSQDKEKLKVDALAFADKLYPLFANMALDPLCQAIGSSYRCDADKRKLPCAIAVFVDHGKETARLVEKHPLKVVLYGIAKVFPGVMKLGDSERIETIMTVMFSLNALAALSMGIYAGMMPVETPNTVETPTEQPPVETPKRKRNRKNGQ